MCVALTLENPPDRHFYVRPFSPLIQEPNLLAREAHLALPLAVPSPWCFWALSVIGASEKLRAS